MSDEYSKPCCVMALTVEQSACMQALLGMADVLTKMGMPKEVLACLKELRPYVGPNGHYMPGEPSMCQKSDQAVRTLRLTGELDDEGERDKPAADPVDVVQQALEKAGGGKVIPVDFVPKNKEE